MESPDFVPLEAEAALVLRGHHIGYLTPLMAPMRYTPEQMAQSLRQDSVDDRGDLTEQTVNWDFLNNLTDYDNHATTYAFDLVGETDAQADAYEATLQKALTDFNELDDDARIKLVSKGIDIICEACTFKQHCKRPDEMNLDATYLDVFEDVLAFAKAKDSSFEASAMRTEEGDVLTTAKAVRRVMGHFAIGKLWSHDLYENAIERRKKYGGVFAGPGQASVEKYYDCYGSEIA